MKTSKVMQAGVWICYGKNKPRAMKGYRLEQSAPGRFWKAIDAAGNAFWVGRNKLFPMNSNNQMLTRHPLKRRTLSKRMEHAIFGKRKNT